MSSPHQNHHSLSGKRLQVQYISFRIGLDPIFPPPFEWPAQKKFALGENALEENKFTLVFDEC